MLKRQIITGFVLVVCHVARCIGLDNNSSVDNDNSTSDNTKLCYVQTFLNDRIVSITSIGEVSPDDAARFERGRLWRRPSRFGSTAYRGDTHGRGTATLLAALCEVCRKNNKRRCLRRFCSVRRRISPNQTFRVAVDCYQNA